MELLLEKGRVGKRKNEIWAIGGGKGGTGKSFITSSIGTYLALKGKRVVLIDADLGGANLHSFLGINRPKSSLTDFFEKKVSLNELVVDSNISNMGVVTGDLRSLDSNSIKYTQKLKFFRQIKTIDTDYILIDLGSGSYNNTIDTFLLADKMIVIVVPEIIAIENMYRFIKSVLFKKLKMLLGIHGLKDFVQDTWNNRTTYGITNLKELIDYLKGVSTDIRDILDKELSCFRIYLILNKIRSSQEIPVGFSAKSICMKYLGFKTRYVGYIEYDDSIWRCINKRQPYMQTYPSSRCAKEIERLTENLIEGRQLKITNA